MAWTNPKTWAAEVLTSADLNLYVRDNQNYLKTVVGLGAPVELTIAAGVVTKTKSYHTIDTQGDDPSDDLDTINGGSDGDVIYIQAADAARTVVVKHNTGNIYCGVDITLDDIYKIVILIYDDTASKWYPINFLGAYPSVHAASHQNGGGDEISLAGLDGEPSTLTTHKGLTTGIHGVGAGAIVGTTLTQTLTNKTLTSPKLNEAVVLSATASELNLLDLAALTAGEVLVATGAAAAAWQSTGVKLSAPDISGVVTAASALTFPAFTAGGDVTMAANLYAGTLDIDDDSGAVTLVDMAVTEAPVDGTEESIAFKLDGATFIKLYSEATHTTPTTDTRRVEFNYNLMFPTSIDSAAVADQVSLGGYELSAGHRALAISSEEVVVVEVDETKFSHKLPVRINGVTYNIMLCAT